VISGKLADRLSSNFYPNMTGVPKRQLSAPTAATTAFAKQTGKSCGDGHTNPKGGDALTPLGAQFKANGNKIPLPHKALLLGFAFIYNSLGVSLAAGVLYHSQDGCSRQ
jgi:hypothetical protein